MKKLNSVFICITLICAVIAFNGCNLASNGSSLEQNSSISMPVNESSQLANPNNEKDEKSSTISLVFPNGAPQINENNAAIFETAPFEVTFSLPDGWTLGGQENTDAFNLMAVFSKTEIVNQEGAVVGAIGFNIYEQYEGAEDDPKAIYNQIALGNDYKFNVRDEYNIVNENPTGNTAMTKVEYAASINEGSDKTNIGIVSYNRDKHVYIAIELLSDIVNTEQAEFIAKSIGLAES
ncbi:MAG: hypothetical protein ACK5L0_01695 [Candidatus Fimivivens sp.]